MSYPAKRAIYALKRLYSSAVDLYLPGEPTFNLDTGLQAQAVTKYVLKHVIVLPTKSIREGRYNRAYIRSNVQFTFGAYTDTDTRSFIVDRKDLPSNFVPSANCYIILNNERYNVLAMHLHEQTAAIEFIGVWFRGALIMQQLNETVKHNIQISGVADNEVI